MGKRKATHIVLAVAAIFGLWAFAACSEEENPTPSRQPAITTETKSPLPTPDPTQAPTPSPAPSPISTPTTNPPASPLQSISETRVIRYVPPAPTEEREGHCFGRSAATPYGWRCITTDHANTIFDPCLVADDGETLVCGTSPARDELGVRFKLTEPLPADDWTPEGTPWPHGLAIELQDDTLCTMKAGGTSLAFDGKRISYWCGKVDRESSNVGILGEPQVGAVWTADRIVVEFDDGEWVTVESNVVPIRTVWQ
jgi:hypothetical protein